MSMTPSGAGVWVLIEGEASVGWQVGRLVELKVGREKWENGEVGRSGRDRGM